MHRDQCISLYYQFKNALTEADHTKKMFPNASDGYEVNRKVRRILYQTLGELVDKQKRSYFNTHLDLKHANKEEWGTRFAWYKVASETLDDFERRETDRLLESFYDFHDQVETKVGDNKLADVLKLDTWKLEGKKLHDFNVLTEQSMQNIVSLCRGTIFAFRSITAMYKVKYFNHSYETIMDELITELDKLQRIVNKYRNEENKTLSQLDATILSSQIKLVLFVINLNQFYMEFEERRTLLLHNLYFMGRGEMEFLSDFDSQYNERNVRILNDEWDFFSVHVERYYLARKELQTPAPTIRRTSSTSHSAYFTSGGSSDPNHPSINDYAHLFGTPSATVRPTVSFRSSSPAQTSAQTVAEAKKQEVSSITGAV